MSTTICENCGGHLIIHITAELIDYGDLYHDVLCWYCGHLNSADENPGPDQDPNENGSEEKDLQDEDWLFSES